MPLTPAFEASVHGSRRDEVLRRMRGMAPGPAVAIFPATPVATRNSDVEHPYRAHSDVYWLTGFEEPEAVVVLSTSGDRPFTLFVRPRDKEKEIWTGRRAGTEGAIKSFGADQAFEIGKLDEELPKLLGSARTLFYRLGGDDPQFDALIARLLRTLRARARAGVNAPPRIEDPGEIVHELRLRKEPRELDVLRKAIELTRNGHVAAMKAGRPGRRESDLHALLEREFRRYYMHRTSHWLGLDVHDVGSYSVDGKARPLEPGMVFTIEPGLYIASDDESAPAELRGIGIRIEDDILVTDSGHENLTASIPRTVKDVEATCSG